MSDSNGHCASYYAATCNDSTRYRALEGATRADVCVIGGGFTGLSTAIELAERGYRVVLLEQHRIGWGASGRNGGQMIGGTSGEALLARHWGSARAVRDLSFRGHEIIEARCRRFGIDCDLRYGYIDVALSRRQVSEHRAWFEELTAMGYGEHLELVDAAQLPAVLGTRRYRGGLINRRNGHLHPLNLCLGEARAASALGVAIHEDSAVRAVTPRAGGVTVQTAGGQVEAEIVVHAGNAYQHLEAQRLSGLVFPAGTFIIATEPLSAAEIAEINPQNLAVCDQNHVLDYYRLSADGRMLFGGRCNYSGREPPSIANALLPRLRRIYPQLADKRVDYAWGGRIGIVVNRVPLIGRLDQHTYYALGYSGHGVNMTHVAGEVIAQAIAGDSAVLDVFQTVPHRRIPFGQAAGNQLVSLGMLYYRLRDLFG
jgi:glycine/D-amino acid oxidase-like deaminating enzyme